MNHFHVNQPTEHDFAAALDWLMRLHLSHRIGFPDCLIASSALRLGVPVVTLNDRHFRLFRGLTVIRPY